MPLQPGAKQSWISVLDFADINFRLSIYTKPSHKLQVALPLRYAVFHGTELLLGALDALRHAGEYKALGYATSVHNPNSIALAEKCGGILQKPAFPHLHFFFKEYMLPVSDG